MCYCSYWYLVFSNSCFIKSKDIQKVYKLVIHDYTEMQHYYNELHKDVFSPNEKLTMTLRNNNKYEVTLFRYIQFIQISPALVCANLGQSSFAIEVPGRVFRRGSEYEQRPYEVFCLIIVWGVISQSMPYLYPVLRWSRWEWIKAIQLSHELISEYTLWRACVWSRN